MKTWALVTGASRGIGAAVAVELAAAGHPIIVNYRSNRAAADRVRERIERQGGRARTAAFDVSDHESVTANLKALLAEELTRVGA